MRGLWALALAGLVSACEGKELVEGKEQQERVLGVCRGDTRSWPVPAEEGRARSDLGNRRAEVAREHRELCRVTTCQDRTLAAGHRLLAER